MLDTPTAITRSDSNISNATVSTSAVQNPAETQIQANLDQEPAAKLGWILIQKGWISVAQLQTILLRQLHQPPHCSQKLGELLIEQAMVTEAQLQDALREQYWRRQGYWVI